MGSLSDDYSFPSCSHHSANSIHYPNHSPNSSLSNNFSGNDCFSEFDIWTPYYRTIVNSKAPYFEEPTFNYKPYHLFALKTQLEPWIVSNIGAGISIGFESKKKDNLRYQTVVLTRPLGPIQPPSEPKSNRVILSQTQRKNLQQKVNSITSSNSGKPLALLFWSRSKIFTLNPTEAIPTSWIETILPYLNPDIRFSPTWSTDGILVDLSKTKDYEHVFNLLLSKLLERVRLFYQSGYLVNPSKYLIENWKLRPAGPISEIEFYETDQRTSGFSLKTSESYPIYRPSWNHRELTGLSPVRFLKDRELGKPVSLKVPENLAIRHRIADFISLDFPEMELSFSPLDSSQSEISFRGDNIDQVEHVFRRIQEASNVEGNLKVLVIPCPRMSYLKLYSSVVEDLELDDFVGYQVSDSLYPYFFSLRIPLESSETILREDLTSRMENKILQILQEKKELLSSQSVHQFIESSGPLL